MGKGDFSKRTQLARHPSPGQRLVPFPAVPIGPERVELSTWLDQVGPLNAIAAILDAESQRQYMVPAAAADPAPATASIEGLGWLAGAVTAAFQSHLQDGGTADPGTATIPLELKCTPATPGRPQRTAEAAGQPQRGWVPMGRISIVRPASGRRVPDHAMPAAPAQAPIPARRTEGTWRVLSEQHLHAHLSDFVAPADAPANIQTAVAGLMAWWKLHEATISEADSIELIGLLHGFIRSWLTQQDPSALPEPTTWLLAAAAEGAPATPELDATLYSSRDVARELNYQDSTIRRCASKSWRQGPGPHPLRGIPGFYVVARPNPGCGRGRGWKFRRVKATCRDVSHRTEVTITQRR